MKKLLIGLLAATAFCAHSGADEIAARQQTYPITGLYILNVAVVQWLSPPSNRVMSEKPGPETDMLSLPLSSTGPEATSLKTAPVSFFRKHFRVLSAIFVGAGSLLTGWIIISMMRRQQNTD